MLRVASLFSGAGGLDLGFAAAGYKIVFAADVNPDAVATYARNLGLKPAGCAKELGVVAQCDVAEMDFSWLRGEADVLIGGPPCQDFSVVRGRRRAGVETARGQLYLHFARALREARPEAFVFENVPGLASSNRGRALREVAEALARPGYELVFAGVLDFSRFGVPQTRERLVIVGVRRGLAAAGFEKSLARLAGLLAKYPLTPLEAFEGKPLHQLYDRYREVMEEWRGVWREVRTRKAVRWKREVWDRLTLDVVEDYLRLNGIAPRGEAELEEALKAHEAVLWELGYLGRRVCGEPAPDGTCNIPGESAAVRERLRRIPPGENHEFVRGTPWEVEGRGISLIYRRLHPLKPAYTVVAYGGGGTHGYHYERSRGALTLREKARLQTFPDSFLFHGSSSSIRAQIGEAVPALGAKRIAEALAETLMLAEQE